MLGKKKLQRKSFFEKFIETKEMEASWTITLSNLFAKKRRKRTKRNTIQYKREIQYIFLKNREPQRLPLHITPLRLNTFSFK